MFDGANLAWGQFYLHAWSKRPESERLLAQPVRDALGEAALSVPAANGRAELAAFAAALQAAAERLLEFLRLEEAAAAPGDIREISEALTEAAGRLAPFAN